MPLERAHNLLGSLVEVAARLHAVAVSAQVLLQGADPGSARPDRERAALAANGCRLGPVAEPGRMQDAPREFLPRIKLASGRNVGMAEDAVCRDTMALDYVAA